MAETHNNTDQYITIDNEFYFTKEGRKLLVSQTGGVKFAILGFMIVQGISPLLETKEYITEMERIAKENNETILQAMIDNGCFFIMNNIKYIIDGKNTLKPMHPQLYSKGLENYVNNLYGTFYLPANEWQTNGDGEYYGTYAFNFDRTYLGCKLTDDVSFSHIVLIGKQYAETSDATFDVSNLQDAGIVGIVKLAGTVSKETGAYDGGIQILQNQNPYVTFQGQLKFTITDADEDITKTIEGLTPEDPNESWPAYWNKRLALVNDGLKNSTKCSGITIGQNKQVLEELELGTDGCIAMTKTLTVAEECLDADDAENQFNAAGLIHPINKFPDEGGEYKPQIIMTSVHPTSALKEDITAYSVGMTTKAEGNEPYFINQTEESGVSSPEFKLGHLPENDCIAVDIFGCDNKKNMDSSDRFLFSNCNSATQPAHNEPNVIIDSDYNSFINGTSNNNNTLIKSSYNTLSAYAKNSLLIDSENNIIDGGNENTLINSDLNTINRETNKNTLYSSKNNNLSGSYFVMLNSTQTSASVNSNEFFIVNSDGTSALENSYSNSLYDSDFNIFSGTSTRNALIYSDRNKLLNTTKNVVMINNTDMVASDAYDDYLASNTHGFVNKTSKNNLSDNLHCSAVSANQNNITRSRYLGVKGLPIGSINSNENPIISDVQSNNNIISRGEYFDLYGSSNNTINNTYFLQSSDDNASRGPVRIKGSTIINSSKSKLYNAREMYLFNSEYSRIYVMHNLSNKAVGLNGCSYEMSNGSVNELYSIYYGEFYNTNDIYAYYGLKGTSYKKGAESIKDNCRPVDMLKLKTQFTNTYGSELNLAGFNPNKKQKYSTPYLQNTNFADANRTLMTPSIKPTNTNIIGGHHNKIVGGTNITILGGEYCKASTYSHQVVMGKFNRDVPADIVYGCGHFNGTIYSQGNKEYYENELNTIETMSGTIDGVRGDVNDINGSTCYNALEFYAHQGKMVLRNCDDGHDRGNNVVSEHFGKTVEIDPTGFKWRDSAGTITSELDISQIQSQTTWTFILDIVNPTGGMKGDGTLPYYKVVSTIGVPASITNLDKEVLGKHLVKVTRKRFNSQDSLFKDEEIKEANSILFNNQIPNKINIILMNLPVDAEKDADSRTYAGCCIFNKIYPWFTSYGKAPRYIKNGNISVEFYSKGTINVEKNKYKYAFRLMNLKNVLDSNLLCVNDNSIKYNSDNLNSVMINDAKQCSVLFNSFNTNNVYTEWLMNGTSNTEFNKDNYYTKEQTDEAIDKAVLEKGGVTESYLTTGTWTANNATVANAINADKVDGYHISPSAVNSTITLDNLK